MMDTTAAGVTNLSSTQMNTSAARAKKLINTLLDTTEAGVTNLSSTLMIL
jgi:hypothetical protein